MARSSFFGSNFLTIGQQVGLMAGSFPQFRRQWSRNFVSWTGDLQPTGMSDVYRIRVEYTFRRRPKVWVLSPQLKDLPDGTRVKHRLPDGSLCLHTPDA